MISDVWGVLWNHADKMVKSKIYFISQGNPHRLVHLRIHCHLAILYFWVCRKVAFWQESTFKNEWTQFVYLNLALFQKAAEQDRYALGIMFNKWLAIRDKLYWKEWLSHLGSMLSQCLKEFSVESQGCYVTWADSCPSMDGVSADGERHMISHTPSVLITWQTVWTTLPRSYLFIVQRDHTLCGSHEGQGRLEAEISGSISCQKFTPHK